jgi:hypothetical protein
MRVWRNEILHALPLLAAFQSKDFTCKHRNSSFLIGCLKEWIWVFFISFLGLEWDWVRLVRRQLFGLLYQPRMVDDKCGAVCGMRIGKGNRSIRKTKPALVELCRPQNPHDLTLARTRGGAVGSRRLTAWAMVGPSGISNLLPYWPPHLWAGKSQRLPSYPGPCFT